ncbi:MFS transporter [Piscibacillus salipiscarius]|uniref:MFS transporter n=1 Tax=Piscibacillus salipiscarius TaxID=299480 RepID=UPI0034E226EF
MIMTNSKLWTPQYIVIISITLLFFLSIHVINSVFPIYVMSFSNNPTIAGLMLTAFMSAAIVTRFVLSLYILNINFRKTIILNLILLFICLMLSYDRESIYFLLLIRFIEGVNFGIISTILATQVSYIIPTKQTGKGFNYFALATTLGASLSPALAIMLFHSSSFNTVIIVTTILVVLMLVFLIFVKSFQTPATQKSLNNKLTMLFDKRAILPCALMFCYV